MVGLKVEIATHLFVHIRGEEHIHLGSNPTYIAADELHRAVWPVRGTVTAIQGQRFVAHLKRLQQRVVIGSQFVLHHLIRNGFIAIERMERQATRLQLPHGNAQGVNIRGAAQGQRTQRFRRHIAQCALDTALLIAQANGAAKVTQLADVATLALLQSTKSCLLGAQGNQHIWRLHIQMQHLLGVAVSQRSENIKGYAVRIEITIRSIYVDDPSQLTTLGASAAAQAYLTHAGDTTHWVAP